MIPGAGHLSIRIFAEAGGARVETSAPAPLPFDRLLRGRPADEAARLVPLLFNICGAAQGLCARAALGLAPDPEAPARVRAETLREHALKLCIELPGILGTAPDPAAPAAMQDAEAAAAHLFGGPVPADVDALRAWAARGETAPARALAALLDWPETWARTAAPAVSPLETWPGPEEARENSVLSRMAAASLTAEALARRGAGPATRFIARLEEAARLLADAPDPLRRAAPFAAAEAARGTMLMRATVAEDGTVASADRRSPTDFALAPGGALHQALSALPEGAQAEPVARAAVALIDPCLPWTLEMGHA